MNTYENYLKIRKYAASTIHSYQKQVAIFIKWCELQGQQPSSMDYKSCMMYLKYLHQKNISKRTINFTLGCVKSYFTYLIAEQIREDNPLATTMVKGKQKAVHYNLLDPETLEALYQQYPINYPNNSYRYYVAKRDKILVGLMVYQGLATSDIKQLQTSSIDLQKGEITIPERKKSNSRILALKPWQILEFMEYLNEVRPYFLNELQLQHNKLLFGKSKRLSLMNPIMKKLKKQHPKLTDYFQIRTSVITNWLKTHNLREVQYMAGHRYISSTEKYLQEDLENLQHIINVCHPIK